MFFDCEGEDLFCRPLAQFFLQKRRKKSEHEKMALMTRIEISQDTVKADQKCKIPFNVHKTNKLLWDAYF